MFLSFMNMLNVKLALKTLPWKKTTQSEYADTFSVTKLTNMYIVYYVPRCIYLTHCLYFYQQFTVTTRKYMSFTQ